ncbi:MAG: hypothetical protein J7513_10365 [Solirubrobacteraceae bacterium]|nr:hypothetical protein [Solirubrobacteraceae bacterium]
MSDDVETAARSLERAKALPAPIKALLKPIKKLAFDMPRDAAALWVLERPEEDDVPYLDVLRFGACDFRETEHAHTLAAPVGWPRYMADDLDQAGVHLAFQNLFVWHFEDFPDEATAVKRRRRRRGRPDVIIIQTGGYPAMRHVFGFNIWSFLARENFGRRLGPLMRPMWRIMDPILRLIGRPAPWHPAEPGLSEFVTMLRRVWPGVPIEFWEMNDPVLEGFWRRDIAQRLVDECMPVLHDLDVPVVAAPPIPQTMALRGANGSNFNEAGSRAVGAHYAQHLLARYRHLARTAAERKAAGETHVAPAPPKPVTEPGEARLPEQPTPEAPSGEDYF